MTVEPTARRGSAPPATRPPPQLAPPPPRQGDISPSVLAGIAAAAAVGVLVSWSPLAAIAVALVLLGLALTLGRGASVSPSTVLLHVLVASMFVESIAVGPVSIGRLLAVIAVIAVAIRLARPHRIQLQVPLWGYLPVLAMVFLAIASGLWSIHSNAWLFALGQMGLAVGFLLAFANLPDRTSVVRSLLKTFTVGAVLAGILGVIQGVTADRAFGLQGDPNIYALYQVAAIPAAISLARSTPSPGARFAWLLGTVPIFASIIESQSRGALVALVPVLLLSTLLMAPPRRRVPAVLAGLVLVAVLAVLALSLNTRFDPERVEQDRASGRIDIWYVAWETFQTHPLTGLGSGNFKPESVELLMTMPGVVLVKSHLLTSEGIEVHNLYLEALVERGVPGLLVTLWLLGQTAYLLLRARHPLRPELDCLLPMLAAFGVGSLFLSVANSKLLWMLVGISLLLWSQPRARRHRRVVEGTHP